MYIPSYNEIKELDRSKYQLSIMVAQRARELNEGAEPTIDTDEINTVTIAMEEILEGNIVCKE